MGWGCDALENVALRGLSAALQDSGPRPSTWGGEKGWGQSLKDEQNLGRWRGHGPELAFQTGTP